jgi:Ca2+-binding RTX toxin-like protein
MRGNIALGALFLILLIAMISTTITTRLALAHGNNNHLGISSLRKLGDKIGDLTTINQIQIGHNTIICSDSVTCFGTNHDDVIYVGSTAQGYGRNGNDLMFGKDNNQLYGDSGSDIITGRAGDNLLDGGSGDDVVLGGADNDLLVGGTGDDKLFAGAGNSIMFGGSGADHFECSPSTTSAASKSVVLDYNPSQGDTISGNCRITNSGSNTSNVPGISSSDSSTSTSGTNLPAVSGTSTPLTR